MPNIDTWLVPKAQLAIRSSGPTVLRKQFATGTAIAADDVVRLFQIPRNMVVVWCKIGHSATLGDDAVATARRETTALTGATTAGDASYVNSGTTTPDEPNTSSGDDYFNILASGDAWDSSATFTYEVILNHVIPGQD